MNGERDLLRAEAIAAFSDLKSLRFHGMCNQRLHREISLQQLQVLLTLQEQGRLTISELANLFGMSLPSASSIVDRMEERGLVLRGRVGGGDRRVVSVEVTDRGREMAEELMGTRRELLERLLSSMDEIELQDVIRGLRALRRAIDRIQSPVAGTDVEPESTAIAS